MTDNSSQVRLILHKAIENLDWYIIDKFVKNGGDINSSLVDSGPTAGYTALHLVVENISINPKVDSSFEVSTFIDHYKPNINSVGKDGVQPIHLACIFENIDAVDALLKSGANVNAEISKECHEKHVKRKVWTDSFDGKVTLLTWAIINHNYKLVEHLMRRGSNFAIKDINNKTLLMYAVEQMNSCSLDQMMPYLHKHPDLINARDNNGLHVVHYIFLTDFREYRVSKAIFINNLREITARLIEAGADMNATVNGDPDTLALNKVAFKLSWPLLNELLKFKVPLSKKSKPLHYLMLIKKDLIKFCNTFSSYLSRNYLMYLLNRSFRSCIECVLKNFVIRRSCGWFVPEEEIKLMDRMVVTDPVIGKLVSDYRKNSIIKLLKFKVVQYDNKFVGLYAIVKKTGDDRLLKLLVKDDSFVEAYNKFAGKWNCNDEEINNVVREVNVRIQKAFRRRKLLEKLEKIENLTKAVPLPYEIILEIIDLIDNNSFEEFINAFNYANDPENSD